MNNKKSLIHFIFSGVVRLVSVCAICGGLFYCSVYPAYLFQTNKEEVNYESMFDDIGGNQTCQVSEPVRLNDKKKICVKKIASRPKQIRHVANSKPDLEKVSLDDIYKNFLRSNKIIYKSSEAILTQKYSYDYTKCDMSNSFLKSVNNKNTNKSSSLSDVSLISVSKSSKSKQKLHGLRSNVNNEVVQKNKSYDISKLNENSNQKLFEKKSFLTPSLRKKNIKSILKNPNRKNNIYNFSHRKTGLENDNFFDSLFSDEDLKEGIVPALNSISSESSSSENLFCPPMIENNFESNKLFVSCSNLSMTSSDSLDSDKSVCENIKGQDLMAVEKSSHNIDSLKSSTSSDSFYETPPDILRKQSSSSTFFSTEFSDNPLNEQVGLNGGIDCLNLHVSRSLDSIPAWVPEVHVNNHCEDFPSLHPTAATENYVNDVTVSNTSSEPSDLSFIKSKSKISNTFRCDDQNKTSIELLVEKRYKKKKSTLPCVNLNKRCFFKGSLKSNTPFEKFLTTQVEKTNEKNKSKSALKSVCKGKHIENYASNVDTILCFSDSSRSLYSVN